MKYGSLDPIHEERIGKVRSTSLGYEDHGIYTAILHMDFGGSSQGVGGFALDDVPVDDNGRPGTAAGMDWIIQVCRVFGGCQWEAIAGKTCLVLYAKGAALSSQPKGLSPLPTERGEPFLFSDWQERWYPSETALRASAS